jgi:RecJ-like exonuclease
MKCPVCDGRGFFPVSNIAAKVCPQCNGTGEMQMTNEEWFCQLPTEEKAKWLEDKMTWAAQEQGTFTAKGWEMWLKQPHHESVSKCNE